MMKKKLGFILVLFIIVCIQLPAAYSIVEKGRWGSGLYQGIFIDGNYAYCAAYRGGIDIIDISNPAKPKLAAQVDKLWDFQSAHEVFVKGNYAYVSSFFGGIHVLDVSNPADPRIVFLGPSTNNYNGIYAEGNQLYIADFEGGILIFNIENPVMPSLTSRVSIGGGPSQDLMVVGNYAYLGDMYNGFHVIDVRNPSAPSPTGHCDVEWYPVDVEIKDNFAYVTNCSTLKIIDISNPSAPAIVSGYNPGTGGALGVDIKGNYAYITRSYKGMTVLDITDPYSPRETGSCEVPGLHKKIEVSGNYAYMAANHKGLQIVDISNPQEPKVAGSFDRSSAFTSMSVSGNLVTLGDEYEGEKVIDVGDPSNPVLVSTTETRKSPNLKDISFPSHLSDTPGGNNKRSQPRGYQQGNYYYETDDVDLIIYDYSDPSNPQQISSISGFNCGTADVYVNGNYAYVAGNATGLYVIDVSNPYNPTYVWKTTTAVFADRVTGNGNYVYVFGNPSGKLYIFEVSNGYPTVSGRVTTAAGNPLEGVKLEFSNNGGNAVTDSNGNYSYKVPNGWNGKITPVLAGRTFSPESIRLTNVTTDTGGQDFTASEVSLELVLSRYQLTFASNTNGSATPPQKVTVSNTGTGSIDWTAVTSDSWLTISPTGGTGNQEITVSVSASAMIPGTYDGTVKVSAQNAADSPQTINVQLTVYNAGTTAPPIGSFDSPENNAAVAGSIAVTGWALDDIGIDKITIYRASTSNPNQMVYIDDALLVEGARTDIEAAYPQYPMNNYAGWGYMLLTNYLPNNGNGSFILYAVATDAEGKTTSLGSKTISCDNENAVKPFGAIETPTQGGTASGSGYINWGWVLTPLPNNIPADGSTIHVWVNGVNLGNPTYNIYRSDIAQLFPNYANSNGAIAYFHLDTSPYENGVHLIQWTATDNKGNTDGIGSRYFTIQNSPSARVEYLPPAALRGLSEGKGAAPPGPPKSLREVNWDLRFEEIPACTANTLVRTGFDNVPLQSVSPDEYGIVNITLPQLDRAEILLGPLYSNNNGIDGFMVVGNRLKPLPSGSTLDSKKGIFYWMPGPAFAGNFDFVFVNPKSPEFYKKIRITIKNRP